jgi:hypothetical protein
MSKDKNTKTYESYFFYTFGTLGIFYSTVIKTCAYIVLNCIQVQFTLSSFIQTQTFYQQRVGNIDVLPSVLPLLACTETYGIYFLKSVRIYLR